MTLFEWLSIFAYYGQLGLIYYGLSTDGEDGPAPR